MCARFTTDSSHPTECRRPAASASNVVPASATDATGIALKTMRIRSAVGGRWRRLNSSTAGRGRVNQRPSPQCLLRRPSCTRPDRSSSSAAASAVFLPSCRFCFHLQLGLNSRSMSSTHAWISWLSILFVLSPAFSRVNFYNCFHKFMCDVPTYVCFLPAQYLAQAVILSLHFPLLGKVSPASIMPVETWEQKTVRGTGTLSLGLRGTNTNATFRRHPLLLMQPVLKDNPSMTSMKTPDAVFLDAKSLK